MKYLTTISSDPANYLQQPNTPVLPSRGDVRAFCRKMSTTGWRAAMYLLQESQRVRSGALLLRQDPEGGTLVSYLPRMPKVSMDTKP